MRDLEKLQQYDRKVQELEDSQQRVKEIETQMKTMAVQLKKPSTKDVKDLGSSDEVQQSTNNDELQQAVREKEELLSSLKAMQDKVVALETSERDKDNLIDLLKEELSHIKKLFLAHTDSHCKS